MLDRFLFGDVQRISPEAPVPVVSVREESVAVGGAGNVAANITSLGARADLVSIVGTDAAGKILIRSAKEKHIRCASVLTVADRFPTHKTRVVGGVQHIVRMDQEQTHPIGLSTQRRFISAISRLMNSWDIFFLSDYAKGVITASLGKKI